MNTSFSIPLPPSFSFEECLWFLNRNYDDCLHAIEQDQLYKVIVIGQQPVLVRISTQGAQLTIDILKGPVTVAVQDQLKQYILEWFDLDKELQAFYTLLHAHPALSYMPEKFQGLRLIGIPDLFEAVCWAIIGQQINLTFAYTLKRRLVEKYGLHVDHADKAYHVFPLAAVLADATIPVLKEMQFSTMKAQYLVDTARAFAAGAISKAQLSDLPDLASRQKALTSMRGIGMWTANYALMKSLQEPSYVPYGDAGLLNALLAHKIIQDKKDAAGILAFFESFAGWESYMVFYLWRSLAVRD